MFPSKEAAHWASSSGIVVEVKCLIWNKNGLGRLAESLRIDEIGYGIDDFIGVNSSENKVENEKIVKASRGGNGKKNGAPKVSMSDRKQWQVERRDLKRRIASAHSVLEEVRRENEELRLKVDALRKSKSMRVGRLLGAPYRFVNRRFVKIRKFLRSLRKSQEGPSLTLINSPAVDSRNRASGLGSDAIKTNPAHSSAILKSETNRAADGRPVLSTLDAFAETPNYKNFIRAVNDLWYNKFEVASAARLILDNRKLVEKASERERATISRVLGAHKLAECGVELPVRSKGAAYLPELGRVMYCTHSTPIYNSNGYSTRTRGMARGMQEAGADVYVVSRAGYPWDSASDVEKPEKLRTVEELDGVKYVHIPGPNLNRDGLDEYVEQTADAFVREAKNLRAEFIMAASNHRTALPALIAARRVGIPFIYEVRGLWEITEASSKEGFSGSERFNAEKDLENIVASNADKVLAITPEVADELSRRGINSDLIALAPNAVDIRKFMPIQKDLQFAEKLKIVKGLPTVGFAGSLVEYEGLSVLLKAAAILNERGVEYQIVIAGSGSAQKSLEAESAALKLSNVRFVGRLPQNDIVKLMSTFDVVACPRVSNEITELVSPLKPLESFATATATVLSGVAPNLTLAGDEGHLRAMVVEPGSAESLANGLERLILDDDLRRNLARAGRKWVVEERQWKMIGENVLRAHSEARSHYESLAGNASLRLSDLRVAVIADEFTSTGLGYSFDTTSISRTDWENQISRNRFDILFVESAWEGNHGEWKRGVGYYSDAEFEDLKRLTAECKRMGIPTVFWNKEDPVHFERFKKTAGLFDHVFTTDANLLPKYREEVGDAVKTLASHSFYAQPAIHNPAIESSEFKRTVAHAGTFYGDRFKKRSEELLCILKGAEDLGLDIFDRQADNPDSPYKFPKEFARFVRGAVPYDQVIKTYGAHLAHINVNSVADSPTMFSRRVVEIPACGGAVVSGPGRGIEENFSGSIPVVRTEAEARAYFVEWNNNPQKWLAARWQQMRTVFRTKTANTELVVLCRTIGIPVETEFLSSYALEVETVDQRVVDQVLGYSFRPEFLITDVESIEPGLRAQLLHYGIDVIEAQTAPITLRWKGTYRPGLRKTHYEDLLMVAEFGNWDFIEAVEDENYSHSDRIIESSTQPLRPDLVRVSTQNNASIGLRVMVPVVKESKSSLPRAVESPHEKKTILVAGHDLKFISGFIEQLRIQGHKVLIDKWSGHNQHDLENSKLLLAEADAVFCEWGLGNAVWYSKNVTPGQRLVVRIHLQELSLPYLRKIQHKNVDEFLTVGEFVRRSAVESHGIPASKASVVFNAVDTDNLSLKKHSDCSKVIGFVGMTPQRKRIDLAIDLLEKLLVIDGGYKLRIKGRLPQEYPWMKNRPDELAWYEHQLRRVQALNDAHPDAVIFDGFGSDMVEWYRQIGIALSTSDFESFHFTIADGAASGALPVSFNWEGADLIYPDEWLCADLDQMVERIIKVSDPVEIRQNASYVEKKFGAPRIYEQLENALLS